MTRYLNIITRNPKLYTFYPLVIYWIILFTLTTLPGNLHIDRIAISDKIKHFTAFMILGFLFTQYLYVYKKRTDWKSIIIFSISTLSIYGAFDEIHQMFVPGRDADILDFLSDFLGVIFGVSFSYLALRSKNILNHKLRK